MSISYSSAAWKDSSFSNISDKFVFLCLCDFSNESGECWPGVETIAERCCMSDRCVQQALKRLIKQGKIDVKQGGGRHKSSRYSLKINPEEDSPKKIHRKINGESYDRKGEKDDRNPESYDRNPEESSPDPFITVNEPSKNHTPAGSVNGQKLPTTPLLEFEAEWCREYQSYFGVYQINYAKDRIGLLALLKNNTPSELMVIAKKAWGRILDGTGYCSKAASTIRGFVEKFNNIRAEVMPTKKQPTSICDIKP